jgi:hypothetical protein
MANLVTPTHDAGNQLHGLNDKHIDDDTSMSEPGTAIAARVLPIIALHYGLDEVDAARAAREIRARP